MSSDKHVVNLNGKQYDAVTGKQVAAKQKAAVKPAKASQSNPAKRVVDGFIGQPRTNLVPKAGRTQPQPSKTLMRTVVKKPATIKPIKTAPKQHAVTAPVKPTTPANTSKQGPEIIRMQHVVHATKVRRSSLISKFGGPVTSFKSDILPVKTPPQHAPAMAVSLPKDDSPKLSAESVIASGLAKAMSHTQPKLHKPTHYQRAAKRLHVRAGTLAVGGGALIALLVAGIFAYNKMPNVAMKVAATRAGFSASLPTYQPAGFSLKNPIDYNPGQVSLQYQSNSDDRNFKVVQRASAWNSDALLEHVVTAQNKDYQTYQANGRTIYIYGGNNATWVDGGVWYQIEGNSNLNSDQLLKIANSL